ncbi:O-antigen ligase family protein [Lunatibacter salilacus]|uniref:O-antigen ligase family protein n=1 Tax=Lunatibacter salilacus TaxID=2483804 RepID=UPI00131D9561|nr:O-antigen ligase family protein [Lunatibacter salilacus]
MDALKLFFLTVELATMAFAVYILYSKRELAVIYLPPIFFAQIIVTPILPAFPSYLIVSGMLGFFIFNNPKFFQYNFFSLLLILLIIFLIPKSEDIVAIRPFIFGVIWLFLLIPLISSIYGKYQGHIIFNELVVSSMILLILFILNVVFSSYAGYAPFAMYGITSGILYGNLYATDFNVLPMALFVVLLKVMNKKNISYFLVFAIALAFVLLSLRRSVMGLSVIGIAFVLYIFLTPKNFKTIAAFTIFSIMAGAIVAYNTDFLSLFEERYQLRDLDSRELHEEKRFLEYELIYKDMFVYQEYDPWIGYELFNSGGNYGKGVLGSRTLHADITNIVHSMGILGFVLYLMMMVTPIYQGFKRCRKRVDWSILFFCSIIFLIYTITGRYTNIGTFIFMMLLVNLPMTKGATRKTKSFVTPAIIKHSRPILK